MLLLLLVYSSVATEHKVTMVCVLGAVLLKSITDAVLWCRFADTCTFDFFLVCRRSVAVVEQQKLHSFMTHSSVISLKKSA